MLLTAFSFSAAFFCIAAAFFWYFMFFRSWLRFLSALFGAAGLLIVFADVSFLVVAIGFIVGIAVTQYASLHGGLDEFIKFKNERDRLSADDKSGSPALGSYEFDYQDANGTVTRRKVDVFKIYYSSDGDGCMDGFCHSRKAKRTFRLDRIFGDVIDLETGEVITLN